MDYGLQFLWHKKLDILQNKTRIELLSLKDK